MPAYVAPYVASYQLSWLACLLGLCIITLIQKEWTFVSIGALKNRADKPDLAHALDPDFSQHAIFDCRNPSFLRCYIDQKFFSHFKKLL